MSKTAATTPQSENPKTQKTPQPTTSKTIAKRAPRKKRLRGNVFKRLRKDAEKTVRESTMKICKALLKQTLLGDVKCAKLLFFLLEKNPNEKTPHPFRDFASILNGKLDWDPNNPEGLPPDEPADNPPDDNPTPFGEFEPDTLIQNVPASNAPSLMPDDSLNSTTPPPKLIRPN